MIRRLTFRQILLSFLSFPLVCQAEDANHNAGNGYDAYNDYNAYNEKNNYYEYYNYQEYDASDYGNFEMENGDDTITYWTHFYIQPLRCVVLKNMDVIVFEVFGNGDQCMKSPMGLYYATVPDYMKGWTDEIEQKMQDTGVDGYVAPEAANYQYCTPKEVNGEVFYLMLGCADDTTQSIAVNVYSDDQCKKKLTSGDTDDARIDIDDIQVPFKKCQACVNWVSKNDDEIDDQFYVKRQMMAPLCSTAWEAKETCGRKCTVAGMVEDREAWTASDLTLVFLMLVFGGIMIALIWRKRAKMQPKNALAEQAALASMGLQQIHIAGFFGGLLVFILICALFGFKNLAFTLLLLIDFTLFAYLLKLTFGNSVPTEEIVGPDGQIITKNLSEDSDDESASSSVRPEHGTYMLPTLA